MFLCFLTCQWCCVPSPRNLEWRGKSSHLLFWFKKQNHTFFSPFLFVCFLHLPSHIHTHTCMFDEAWVICSFTTTLLRTRRQNMQSNMRPVDAPVLFSNLRSCLPGYLTVATCETCCQLHFVVVSFSMSVSPRDWALTVDHFIWDIRPAAELSLPSTEASKTSVCSFIASFGANGATLLMFCCFWFHFSGDILKMHNYTFDIWFEFNSDDNGLSAPAGKTLTHMFCFQFSCVQ